MKTQITIFLVVSWIAVAAANAAQRQTPTNDVSARVFNSADILVSQSNSGDWQTLTFDSERWDTRQLHESVKNPGRLQAPVAGKYYIFAHIAWQSPIGTGSWGVRLRLNGNTVIAEQTAPNNVATVGVSMSVGTVYALAAGDYVEVQVFQNNGGSLAVRHVPAASPEFGMARMP